VPLRCCIIFVLLSCLAAKSPLCRAICSREVLILSRPFVVLLTSQSTIPMSIVLGDTLSSHHLSVYVSCQLMGDTLRPSFDGSLPIDFNTLSKTGI
jgi:hypothetical protein